MTIDSALQELDNAVLDLQTSDYNTYVRPLTRISDTLASDDLKVFTDVLKAGVDFDVFLAAANKGGSMVGSASLNWPTNREEELGLSIIVIERGADDPNWFLNFAHDYYYGGRKHFDSIRKLMTSIIIPFSRDFRTHVEKNSQATAVSRKDPTDFGRVFIVHGHDEASRETVARFIVSVGLEPVILHEQANRGMTVLEKLIANGDVGYAVVLLTPDDLGRSIAEGDDKPRARQNVILELGYFLGRLGRERVMALLRGSVEIPSDYLGVLYEEYDDGGGWRRKLARELQTAGYEIDWNKVMR